MMRHNNRFKRISCKIIPFTPSYLEHCLKELKFNIFFNENYISALSQNNKLKEKVRA